MLKVFQDLVISAWSEVSALIHLCTAPLRGQNITIVYSHTETKEEEHDNTAAEEAV